MARATTAVPAPQRTLSDQAYDAIKRRIICLEMAPGESFTEGQLAAEMPFSKTPVREALARLQQEGLVELNHRAGYRVAPVTLKDVRDLFDLRILLEGEVAYRAAGQVPHVEQLRALEELSNITYDPEDHDSIDRGIRANTVFHATLAAVAGNRRLAGVLEQALDQMERLLYLGLAVTPPGIEIMEQHHQLVKAILGGDQDRARELAVAQIRAWQNKVVEALLSSEAILATNISSVPPTRSSLSVVRSGQQDP